MLLAGCAHAIEPSFSAAQPPLPSIELQVGAHQVRAEVADDAEERQLGLMFREKLSEDEGMLFVYPSEENRSFWMKNTLIPLSIAYLDMTGRIVHIADMTPLDIRPVPSGKPAMFALEMNQGWFIEHDVSVGERVSGLPVLP